MNKPDEISQAAWDAGLNEARFYADWLHAGNSRGELSEHAILGMADSFARAIGAAEKRGEERAALEVRWQAMETAPQDGTPVLAILNTQWDDRIDQMNMDVIWFDVGGWHSGGVEPLFERTGQYPIYWRPLPPAPNK